MFAMTVKDVEDIFLICSRDGTISVTKTAKEMTSSLENAYARKHLSGYEASMSACIHSVLFNPKVIEIPESIDELKELLEAPVSLYSLSSVAGSYYGVKIKKSLHGSLKYSRSQPRLIS